jgi:competence protein ComEC
MLLFILISLTACTTAPAIPEGQLQVIVFDVGQADCILLLTDTHAMLIDAGNIGQTDLILGYLAEYRVTKLDYIAATHPHADHIGSMAGVILGMDSVGTVLMPDAVNNTRTFERLLDAIEERDIPVTISKAGDSFAMGEVNIQVLAPVSERHTNLNDSSLVLRVQYGAVSFLFTGDAEDRSEREQLDSRRTLSADVLKVGHHGSRTSSTRDYLRAVSPRYAVIPCGEGNSYGHPHSEVLDRLAAIGAAVYRTDLNGTVIFTTDGETIAVTTARGSGAAAQPIEPQPTTEASPDATPGDGESFIGNVNSKAFHLPTCRSLPAEQNRTFFNSRTDAVDDGYTPCGICNP